MRILVLALFAAYMLSGRAYGMEYVVQSYSVGQEYAINNVTVSYDQKKHRSKVKGMIRNLSGSDVSIYMEIMFFDANGTQLGSVKHTSVSFINGSSEYFSGTANGADLRGWSSYLVNPISVSPAKGGRQFGGRHEYRNLVISPTEVSSDSRFPVRDLAISIDQRTGRSQVTGTLRNASRENFGSPIFRLDFYDNHRRSYGSVDIRFPHLSAGEAKAFSASTGDLRGCERYSLTIVSSSYQKQDYNVQYQNTFPDVFGGKKEKKRQKQWHESPPGPVPNPTPFDGPPGPVPNPTPFDEPPGPVPNPNPVDRKFNPNPFSNFPSPF